MSLLQKRLIEVEKRKKHKELKEKEKEERRKRLADMEEDEEQEEMEEEEDEEDVEEEPLPEIFIPSAPCHILCGFYSGPGKFWVSLVSNNVINSCYVIPKPTYLIIIIFSTCLLFFF